MVGTVSVSRLSGHASQVIRKVEETGEATFVTKRGRLVAIIAPVNADGTDDPSDHVLANAPEYVTSMRQADEDLAAGRTSSMVDVVADLGG